MSLRYSALRLPPLARMSKKHKKDGNSPTRVWDRSDPDNWLRAEAQVEQLLSGQHSKAALEAAKDLHKSCGTPQSENLLVRAYQARIRDLLKHGLAIEAKSLVDLVVKRFPAASASMEDALLELRLRAGNLDALVAPLEDPKLASELREKIENTIRQQVFDLHALSRVSTLSPASRLRQAAGALVSALEKVTSGPVEEADLLVPEVSQRSPLAPWKALVNAIASFYRRDDRACRQWLGSIPGDSVPARLVPALNSMSGSGNSPLNSAAQKLIAAVGAGDAVLRDALVTLESAFVAEQRKQISVKIRAAVSACRQFRPDICERLRELIAARSMLLDLPANQVHADIGGRRIDSARGYLLMARAIESTSERYETNIFALVSWCAFRETALEEKWFARGTVEDGVLWLHMAALAARIPAEVAEDLRLTSNARSGHKIGAFMTPELFSPDCLYEKACAADPHPEAFQSWLSWARKQPDRKKAERAAQAWHESRPQDVAPLLWLMEASERRGAYQKSLSYLEDAERLDRLSPAVQRARLRLLVASALRHLRQRKPHLALPEIECIRELSLVEGNLPLVVSALRTVCAAVDRDPQAMPQQAEVGASGGDRVAGYLLERAIAERSIGCENTKSPPDVNGTGAETMLKGLAQACAVGDAAGIPVAIPEEWQERLMAAFLSPGFARDTAEMLVIGGAALRSQASELAFTISSAGMARGGADARFLFLRARSLPPWAAERRYSCLTAALELARRERDTELAARLLDALDEHMKKRFGPEDFFDELGPEGYAMEAGRLAKLLEEERAAKRFPRTHASVPSPWRRPQDRSPEDDLPEFDGSFRGVPREVLGELAKAIALGATPAKIAKYLSAIKSPDGEGDELKFLPPVVSPEVKQQERTTPANREPSQQDLF